MKFEDTTTAEDGALRAALTSTRILLQVAVDQAEKYGLTVCVETVPQQPLTMGNVKHVFNVRPNLANVRAKMERDRLRGTP